MPKNKPKQQAFRLTPRNQVVSKATPRGLAVRIASLFRDRESEAIDGVPVYSEHVLPTLPDPSDLERTRDAIQLFKDTIYRPYIGSDAAKEVAVRVKVQNPFLQSKLKKYADMYNVRYDNGCPVFERPFQPLYFARHELALQREQYDGSSDEYKLLSYLLNQILSEEMYDIIQDSQDLEEEHKITWEYLWTLFEYDSIVVARVPEGHEQAYQVVKTQLLDNDPPYMNVVCQYVSFDGHRFGFADKTFILPHFSGKKSISDLAVFPIRLARRGDLSEGEDLRRTFLERGTKVLGYQGVRHVHILPARMDRSKENYDELLKDLGRGDQLHGRAIVDFHTAARRNIRWQQSLRPIYDTAWVPAKRREDPKGKAPALDWHSDTGGPSSLVEEEKKFHSPILEDSMARLSPEEQAKNRAYITQEDENLVIMSPLLHAFSLESKEWVTVNVEAVTDVNFSGEIYDHLVANETHKQLLLDLVQSETLPHQGLEDPVSGKGKGLLILLSGPPGTGKTLMAEAIAERARRPLYYVDARELGQTYTSISQSFSRIMEDSTQWNAIVLLDEADAYLQQRFPQARDSNERVTAFLRHLEYFKGILFMTTNLFDSIDIAVESRLHIHLEFVDLSYNHRQKIWGRFLRRTQGLGSDHRLTPQDVLQLARWKINGRQIKNAFRMALAISRYKKTDITLEALEEIIPMSCPRAIQEKEPLDALPVPLLPEDLRILVGSTQMPMSPPPSLHPAATSSRRESVESINKPGVAEGSSSARNLATVATSSEQHGTRESSPKGTYRAQSHWPANASTDILATAAHPIDIPSLETTPLGEPSSSSTIPGNKSPPPPVKPKPKGLMTLH